MSTATTTTTTAQAPAPRLVRKTMSEEDAVAMKGMAHQGRALPGIPVFATHAETRRWMLEHMAAAFRVFAREGYAEGISGHISVRDPACPDRFWINPLGVHFAMMRASDMICVSHETGEVLAGNVQGSINAAGYQIHAAVHRARPDVHAICHTHSVHGRAYSSFGRPLEMINQDACYLYNAHAVYDQYGGIANEADEGQRIAAALGPTNKACILQNHGLLTVGHTVDEAAFLFVLMERCCRIQMLADASGQPKRFVSDAQAAYNFRMASTPECLYTEFQPHYKYEEFLSSDFKDLSHSHVASLFRSF